MLLLEDNGKVGERRKVSGRKVVPNYRLRTPKRSFAYTQTIVRLCANANTKKESPLDAERGISYLYHVASFYS